jgi:hypothetical protein
MFVMRLTHSGPRLCVLYIRYAGTARVAIDAVAERGSK